MSNIVFLLFIIFASSTPKENVLFNNLTENRQTFKKKKKNYLTMKIVESDFFLKKKTQKKN